MNTLFGILSLYNPIKNRMMVVSVIKVFKIFLIINFIIIAGCQSQPASAGQLKSVGLLLPNTINEKIWSSKGYKGLLEIHSTYGVDVHYKEETVSKKEIKDAVQEFAKKNVNLIFGHGHEYAESFMALKDDYPKIRFVTFNGEVQGKNITSLHFEGEAMGFFGGMVASKMSKNKSVGVIAAFPWQPEVDGFIEGAVYENRQVSINYKFVQSWDDTEKALKILDKMIAKGVDVFYPAGDMYNIPLVKEIKKQGLYAIGYVSDQKTLGKKTILTSTVQHVDELYLLAAKKFNSGELKTGNIYFGFNDGVVSMGTFSPVVPDVYVEKIEKGIDQFIETGELPYKLH